MKRNLLEFQGKKSKSIDSTDSDLRPDNAGSDTLVTHAEIKLSEVALTNFYMNTFSMMACFGAMSVYLNANRSLLVSGSVNIALMDYCIWLPVGVSEHALVIYTL